MTEEAMDPVPRAITLQDVRRYRQATGEEEQELIRAELASDTREATTQVTMVPGRRIYPSQTPAPTFSMSSNPDRSISLEHAAIHIRILDPLVQRD